uniref:Pentacotripeptide-repeat region of PRORP domain-containing protein n=1 Tax=Branchiostoma floridae TaxID=7739 RepID=C4A0T2_BRAFL|eukprot:XP_002585581.1 hypothetical protein BRAFLDRAFT_133153 [Branchiostoma floridae]
MTLILRLTSVRSFRSTIPTLGSSVGLGSVWFGGCPTCNKLRTAARYQNAVAFRTYANVAAKKKDPRVELYTVLSSRAQQLSKPEKGEGVRQRQKKQEILKKRKVSSHVRLEPMTSPLHLAQQTHAQRSLSSKSSVNMYTTDDVEQIQTSQRDNSVSKWQATQKKPFGNTPRVTESLVEEELDVLEEEEEAREKIARRQEEMEKMKNMERRQNEEQAYILSFMEACVSIGEVDRATRTLHYLKNQKKKRKHLNADIYNVVLKGWAKQANMDKIRHLFFMMTKDALQPNLQSYAAALECMGRAGLTGGVPIRCVKQMYKEGFNLEDIFRDCTFEADEQENILKDESLQVQPLFTEDEVLQRCDAQLEMETQHWLKVESVEGQRQSSQEVLKLIGQIYQDYCNFMVNNNQGGKPGQARELWCQLEGGQGVGPGVGDECAWPINLIINLGSLLVDAMVREVKIDNNLFRKTSEQ